VSDALAGDGEQVDERVQRVGVHVAELAAVERGHRLVEVGEQAQARRG
jgi:hypothetical protein